MAVKNNRDNQRYKGVFGGVKRYFDAETTDRRTMGRALREDFCNGALLRERGDNFSFMVIPGGIAGFMSVLGLIYQAADVPDYVDLDEAPYTFSLPNGYGANDIVGPHYRAAFTTDSERPPFLITSTEDGIAVYEALSTGDFHHSRMETARGWEWRLLDAGDAYQALAEVEYHAGMVAEAVDLDIIDVESLGYEPFSFEMISGPYMEGDSVKITTMDTEPFEYSQDDLQSEIQFFDYAQNAIAGGAYASFSDLPQAREFDEDKIVYDGALIAMYSMLGLMGLSFGLGTINMAHTAVTRRKRVDDKGLRL